MKRKKSEKHCFRWIFFVLEHFCFVSVIFIDKSFLYENQMTWVNILNWNLIWEKNLILKTFKRQYFTPAACHIPQQFKWTTALCFSLSIHPPTQLAQQTQKKNLHQKKIFQLQLIKNNNNKLEHQTNPQLHKQ